MKQPKDEPEMLDAYACKQCGFDLRLPPECTKERWAALNAVAYTARELTRPRGPNELPSGQAWNDLKDALGRLAADEDE